MSAIKLTRRGSSAAGAPPVTGGLPFYGSWPAASGPWPLPWTTMLVGSGSIVQNNGVGVLSRPNGTQGFTVAYPSTAAIADVDVRFQFTYAIGSGNITGRGVNMDLLLRWSGGMGTQSNIYEPADCYLLRWRRFGAIQDVSLISKDVHGNGTVLYSIDSGWAGSPTSGWVRFQIQDNMLKFKFWRTSDPEPVGWDFEGSDTTHINTGYVALAYGNLNLTNSHYPITIHSFSLTAPTGD